uniref:Universal stress protein n=1 Tax=Archaeoglobus fulgidus TaxID=2234 RepID=A0A7J2TI11_ARCFL
MFNRIFFPFDLSKTAEELLYATKELGRLGVKKLTVFYAIEYNPEALAEGGVDLESFLAKLNASASLKLKNVTKRLSEFLETEYKLSTTIDAAEEILKRSAEYDLMIIPSKSRTPFQFGRVAERVIRRSQIPTLVIKANPEFGRKYYEFLLSRLLDKVAFVNLENIPEIPGVSNVLLVNSADLDSILEQKLSKEEIMHPLTPIPKLPEYLSEYWMTAKEKLERVKKQLEYRGVKAEILICLSGKLEENLKDRNATMVIVRKDDFPLVSDFPAILVLPNF